MNAGDISSEVIDRSFSSAYSALKDDSSLEWIRGSSLFERAYLLGLRQGLVELAGAEAAQGLFAKALVRTMHERSADDSFGATSIGVSFVKVEDLVRNDPDVLTASKSREQLALALDSLIAAVKSVDKACRQATLHIDQLVDQLKKRVFALSATSDAERHGDGKVKALMHELCGLIEELESPLRYVALLETDHKLSTRVS